MTSPPDWLPPLMCLEDFGGNWERYIEAVYASFKHDFIESQARFKSRPVRLKRYPFRDGKEAAFWHITSEGREEDQRVPDLRRCERIRWPRPTLEHPADSAVRCWRNERGGERRIVLWLWEQDYVVILAERGSYVLLWTAYQVSYEHTRRKLQQEYEDSEEMLMPP